MTSTSPHDRPPHTTEELLAAVRGTPYDALLRDEATFDAVMFDLLKQSRDPVAREVGEGLADGSLSVRQLGDSDVYADFVRRGLDSAATLDPGSVLDELAEEREAAEAAERRPGAAGGRHRDA